MLAEHAHITGRLDRVIDLLERNIHHYNKRLEQLMTIAEQIQTSLAQVSANVVKERDARIALVAKFDGFAAAISALKQQIIDLNTNAGGLSAADTQGVLDTITAIEGSTDSEAAALEVLANTEIDPAPPAPEPAPEPAPAPEVDPNAPTG